jgi:hypothetical protein
VRFHVICNLEGMFRGLAGFGVLLIFCVGSAGGRVSAAEWKEEELASRRAEAQRVFREKVTPFIRTYCFSCHGDQKQKGGVTFQNALSNPGASAFVRHWRRSAQVLRGRDMPPEEADKQPTPEEISEFERWVEHLKFLSSKDPGPFVIRRLTKTELGNTLHDFLGVPAEVVKELPEEVTGAGYLNTLSPMLMEQVLALANEVLTRALDPLERAPNALETRLFGAIPAEGLESERVREIVAGLARTAYRRPVSEDEVGVLERVYELALKDRRPPRAALRFVLKAVLISPQFLFITPSEIPDPQQAIVPLDDHQIASRLSYLLWASAPDAELRRLAESGTLRNPEVLMEQARRLMASPRSRALFDGFGAQWLGVGKLAEKTFDAAKFPQMTPGLRQAMYEEARLFFEAILRENRSIGTFLNSDFTFVNRELASVYGLSWEGTDDSMRRVQLKDGNRGGLLAMPGVLAATSFPNRTSPVNRGVWVLEQILGEHVPPPPPNVPSLEKQDPKKVANLTLRQRTEMHRSNAVCASCHRVLDPIGFGLENFDAIGRWRDQDESGGRIDAVGELPGEKRFSSPRELKGLLLERSGELRRSLTGQLLAYALGRQLEGYDELVLDQLTEKIAGEGDRMQSLVSAVVTSYPFLHRRLTETPVTPTKK